jgi:hypothetical protein
MCFFLFRLLFKNCGKISIELKNKKMGAIQMLSANTVNDLSVFINKDVIELAKKHNNEIESVSYGLDSGCGYKNDVFVSFSCTDLQHGDRKCMCRDILEQQQLTDVNISLELAANIAHYVSGLIGGRRVYLG